MSDEVRRGRRIIGAYAAIHLSLTAALVALSIAKGWPWQRMIVRALTQTAFVHSLWRGSRWAQWLHVAGFVLSAAVLLMLGARRPSPVMWTICGGIAFFFLWLSWLFGFSPSVRAFLAHQRGELRFSHDSPRAAGSAAQADDGRGLVDELGPEELVGADGTVVCAKCGEGMKSFVVVCPRCGRRR